MRKPVWLVGLLTVILLVSSTKETQAACLTPKTRQKDNANAPSGMALDYIDAAVWPWVCAVAAKDHRKSNVQACENHSRTFSVFNKSDIDMLEKNRVEQLHKPFRELNKKFVAEQEFIFQKLQLTQRAQDEINHMVSKINYYRLITERVIFAQHQQSVNCDEHAARAYLDELVRMKNGCWSKYKPKKMHQITLKSHDGKKSHVFIVAGSHVLSSGNHLHNMPAVKNILGKMDGTLIDYWNNPTAGGVRMRVDKARERYEMYSGRTNLWDSIQVVELPTHEIHDDIEKMNAPKEVKASLLRYAGPRLEEIQQGLPLLEKRLSDTALLHHHEL